MESLKIKVDLKRKSNETLSLQQGYTYPVEVQVFDNGQEYNCTGAMPQVHFGKANGKFTIKTKDITIEGNKVRFKIDGNMTNISGSSKLQIVLTRNEDVFGSWVIYTNVSENAIQDSDKEDKNVIDVLTDLTQKITTAEPLVASLEKNNPIADKLSKKIESQIPEARKVMEDTANLIQNGGAVDRQELGEGCFTDFEGNEYGTLKERLDGDFGGLYEAINNATYLEYEGYNETIDNCYKGMTKDLTIQGNTIQNLVKEETNSPKIIKGEMTSEEGVSLTLPVTSKGIVDLTVKGKTLQNLHAPSSFSFNVAGAELNTDFTVDAKVNEITINRLTDTKPRYNYISCGRVDVSKLKPNTQYTVVFEEIENVDRIAFQGGDTQNILANIKPISNNKALLTTIPDFSTINSEVVIMYIHIDNYNASTRFRIKNVMILEGDHTNTPIEELPYGEGIYSTGEHSPNLFNKATITTGFYINGNGELVASGGDYYSDYIPVDKNTTYNMSNTNIKRIALYDSEKRFIKRVDANNTSPLLIETEEGTFVRISRATAYVNDVQFERGTTFTGYKPYICGDKYLIKAKSTGKNLFNESKIATPSGSNYLPCRFENGKIVLDGSNPQGGLTTRASGGVNVFLVKGKSYKVSFHNVEDPSSVLVVGNIQAHYLKDGVVDSTNQFPIKRSETYIHDKETGYYFLRVFTENNAIGIAKFNLMVEENTVATTYEAYQESLAEALLDEPLRSLPNGVCDEIRLGQLIRRVGKTSVAELGNWILNTKYTTDNNLCFTYTKDDAKYLGDVISDKFSTHPQSGLSLDMELIHMSGTSSVTPNCGVIFIKINKDKLQTQDNNGFKAWAKENPITIYYELIEPIITDLPQGFTIDTFSGKTHVMTENTMMPKIKVESVGTKYPVMLKPSKAYTVRWLSKNRNDNIGVRLSGGGVNTVDRNKSIANLTTPSVLGDEYLYLSGWNVTMQDVAVYEGTIADIGKLPYVQGIESSGDLQSDGFYKVKARTCGKNLFDVENIKFSNTYIQTIIGGRLEYIGFKNSKRATTDTIIALKPNTSYSISCDKKYLLALVVADKNKIVTRNFIAWASEYSFTTADEHYMKLSLKTINESDISINDVAEFNIQLEENTATPYEEYLSEHREFTLEEPLRSLPNGVRDEILEDGTLIRRIGEYTFTGLENWNFEHNENWIYPRYRMKPGFEMKTSDSALTKYWFGGYDHAMNTIRILNNEIYIYDSRVLTLEEFKARLRTANVKMLYELATPVITKISNTINLKTYKGTTHLIADTHIPLNLKAKLPVNVQSVVSQMAYKNAELLREVNTLTEEKKALQGQINGLKEDNGILNDKIHQVDNNLSEKMGNIENAIDGFNQMLVSVIPLFDEMLLKK